MRTAAKHLAPPDLRVILSPRSLARSRWGALGGPARPPQSRSIEQRLALTTVQRDERAVHEARPLGGHEDGHVGHLLGRADPAERDAALGPLLRFVDADLADLGDPADQIILPLGGHRARIGGVDAVVVIAVLPRQLDSYATLVGVVTAPAAL